MSDSITLALSSQCHAPEARELLHAELERAYRREFAVQLDLVVDRVLREIEQGAAMDTERPDRFEME